MCNCWNTFRIFKCCAIPPAAAWIVPEEDGGCGGRVPVRDSDGDDDAVDAVVKVGVGDNEVLVVVVVAVAPLLLLLRRFMIAPDRIPTLPAEFEVG